MDLQVIFDQLSAGELRNVFLGDTTEGELSEDRKRDLITHINMGLTELHKRFLLKEKTAVINLVPDTYRYQLDQPDLLRVEGVRDLADNEYLLNVLRDPESMHTPNYRTLDIPKDLQVEKDVHTLEVFYRANHPAISKDARFMDASTVEIDLPYTHLEALLYYVASRVMNPIGMSESFHDGNNYAAKYEQAVQQIGLSGYGVQQDYADNQFKANGWV